MKKAKQPTKPLTDDDRDYVTDIHERTHTDVERFARKLTNRNAVDAEDLTQETYARFSERIGKYGPLDNEVPEKAYLMRIAKNARNNEQTRNQLQSTTLISEAEDTGDAHQDSEASHIAGLRQFQEHAAAVRRSTYLDRFKTLVPIVHERLTADEWQLIKYRWVEELTFDEIAAITGQPRDQVAHRVSRATQKARYWGRVFLKRQTD